MWWGVRVVYVCGVCVCVVCVVCVWCVWGVCVWCVGCVCGGVCGVCVCNSAMSITLTSRRLALCNKLKPLYYVDAPL